MLNVHERDADRYQAYHCMAFSGLIKAKESQQIRGEGEREEKRREEKEKRKLGCRKKNRGDRAEQGRKEEAEKNTDRESVRKRT